MNINWGMVLDYGVTLILIPLIGYIGAKIGKLIEANIKDKNVRKYLTIATDCVADAVADISQTFVDHVKEEDWNEDTKQEAFNKAREKALLHLGATGKTLLEEVLGDFDSWIDTKVEAEVKRLAVK